MQIFDKASSVVILEQQGFVPGRSTVSNLVTSTNIVLNSIAVHIQVDTFYSDFLELSI